MFLVVAKNLAQEVDVARRQSQGLNFRELIWRQSRDDLS